jgi:hypothetical protein
MVVESVRLEPLVTASRGRTEKAAAAGTAK